MKRIQNKNTRKIVISSGLGLLVAALFVSVAFWMYGYMGRYETERVFDGYYHGELAYRTEFEESRGFIFSVKNTYLIKEVYVGRNEVDEDTFVEVYFLPGGEYVGRLEVDGGMTVRIGVVPEIVTREEISLEEFLEYVPPVR